MTARQPSSNPIRTCQLAEAELRRRLGSQWPVGAWLPPLQELARILNSGQVNTQRAVASLAGQGYLLSLRGKGTLVRRLPAPEPVASEVMQPSRRFTLVHSHNTDPLIMRMVQACQQELAPVARRVDRISVDIQSPPSMMLDPMDGMVLFSPGPSVNQLSHAARHCVTVASWLPDGDDSRGHSDLITVDQEHGGYLAGRLLRQIGCQLSCFIGRSEASAVYDANSQARLRGFERGFGQTIDSDRLMYGRYYGPLTGSHAFGRWFKLDPRPTAVFAVSDEIAVGFLMAAMSQGLTPGVDFHLVGFDGQERGKLPETTLTTIAAPAIAMGKLAARLLLQRLDDPTPPPMKIALQPSLFLGQTTALPSSVIRTTGADPASISSPHSLGSDTGDPT
jgi:DNA-binding LacI/PurR family transcriptional regulator